MPKTKQELLSCAESAAKYISDGSDKNSIGFISFIEDMIKVVDAKKDPNDRDPAPLYRILYNVKNSSMDVLGGGKSLKQSYVNFIDFFLQVSKVSDEYRPANKEFAELDLDELAYVFGWIRRLSKAWTETERQSGGGRRDNRDRGSERTGRRGDKPRFSRDRRRDRSSYDRGSEGQFNTQLFEQLKNWQEKQKG